MAAKKAKAKSSKKERNNPVTGYLKGVISEVKQVTWPNRKETIQLTMGVVAYSIVFALFIALVDYAFDLGFEEFIINQ